MIEGRKPLLARAGVFLATLLLLWLALSTGVTESIVEVVEGQVSPGDFVATERLSVVKELETQEAKDTAAAAVEPSFSIDDTVAIGVESGIEDFISLARTLAVREAPPRTEPELPELVVPVVPPSTTTSEGQEPEPVVEPITADVSGSVFLDLNGDAVFDPDLDLPSEAVEVWVFGANASEIIIARTDADGFWLASNVLIEGSVTVWVNLEDEDIPSTFELSTGNNPQVVEGTSIGSIVPVGFRPRLRSYEELTAELGVAAPGLDQSTVEKIAKVAQNDVIRAVEGRSGVLADIQEKAISVAQTELTRGIKRSELALAQANIESRPPRVLVDELQDNEASDAAADLATTFLAANNFENESLTAQLRQEARDATEDVTQDYVAGLMIVREGDQVGQVEFDAIASFRLAEPDSLEKGAMAALIAVTLLLLFVYLARFRPGFWGSLRRVTLFGLILVMAGAGVRAIASLENVASLDMVAGYALPAAGFGFLVAVVFDARIAVLMSLAIASISAMVFQDPGLVLYAGLATVAPVPMVSAIASTANQRWAILTTGVTSGIIAAAIAWFFHAPIEGLGFVWQAAFVATVVGWFSSIFAIFLVQVFEVVFDITTNLRLLELVDRNHNALQLLQEKAWGTFNHSLMVGTLADRAARAIGANALLARASAYYHDLGKTENPIYFIENQFGITNPHDMMSPAESVEIIRQHVVDGVELAKRFHLPSEVTEAISSHHGDGIMRYFYETAKEQLGEGNVNPDDFRHLGHKPRSKEMAIVMMADSLEGATRAVFSLEEPSRERIERVVETIVGEKVADDQLSECALTLGELTQVKQAFIEAFVGHYHQRIAYPDFTPTPPAIEGSAPGTSDLPDETVEGDLS
jgi:putative nucleotidyltransferase with HDIG domain